MQNRKKVLRRTGRRPSSKGTGKIPPFIIPAVVKGTADGDGAGTEKGSDDGKVGNLRDQGLRADESLPALGKGFIWPYENQPGESSKDASSDTKHVGMKRKRGYDDPLGALAEMNLLREKDSKNPRLRMTDAAVQIGSYGLELMTGTRGARTSCFSASMKDDRIWFWYYDPTGILYTDTSISMVDDFEYFAAIIVAFASCTPEQFGALPRRIVQPPDGVETTLLKEDLRGHKLVLCNPKTNEPISFTFTRHIFTQYGLTGRRTFVYEADPSPRNGLPEVIVKCSYQAAGRRPEHELIEHARKHDVPHIPNVHMWGDLWTLPDIARESYRLSSQRARKAGEELVEPEYEDRIFRVIVYTRYYSIRNLLRKPCT